MDNEILQLFRDVKGLIHPDDVKSILQEDGGLHRIDGLILYASVLKLNPEFTIEFSPQYGYSTARIALALKRLGKKGCFATFELNDGYKKGMTSLLDRFGVKDYVEVIYGNALDNIPKYIHQKKIEGKTKFVFIDSDHSEAFAKEYITKIFPLFDKGCTAIVHDIGAKNNNEHGEFVETLDSKDPNSGEYKALRKYVDENHLSYCVTHAIFGGKHESSEDLPVNKAMFEEVGKIIGHPIKSGFCSKLLVFKMKGQ